MPKKNTPGCHCCQGCVIYSDDFQRDDDTDVGGLWDERDGDWEIDAGDLICDGPGLIVVDQLHPDGDNAMVVTAIVRGDTANDTARLVLCRQDDSNYLFVQLRFVNNFSSALRLGKVEAGVETFLTNESTVFSGLLTDITIIGCYADGTLSGQVFDSGLYRDTQGVPVSAPGTTAGVAIGQQNGVVRFRSFAWEYHNSEDRPSCRSCAEPCTGCAEHTTPYALQVEFQGVQDGTGFTPCDDCSVLNNRAFLLRPNTSNACFYTLTSGIGCGYGFVNGSLCGNVFPTNYLALASIGGAGVSSARFLVEDVDGDCFAFRANCAESYSGLPLYGVANNNVCNWDNATCTITPLR